MIRAKKLQSERNACVRDSAGERNADEKTKTNVDPVDEALLETFPASDPPCWWTGLRID